MGDLVSETVVVATDGSAYYDDIQEAIDSLPPEGGSVSCKEGVFTITGLTGISYLKLKGVGYATEIKMAAGVYGPITPMLSLTNRSYVVLEDLRFNGNKANATGTVFGIHVGLAGGETSQTLRFNRVFIHDVAQTGLNLDGAAGSLLDVIISQCPIIDCGLFGININSLHNDDEGAILISNRVSGSGGDNIRLTLADKTSLINNKMLGSVAGHGIHLQHTDHAKVTDNIGSGNNGDGIRLERVGVFGHSYYNKIIGNTFNNNGGWGINEQQVENDYNTLLGNTLLNNTAGKINYQGANSEIGHDI